MDTDILKSSLSLKQKQKIKQVTHKTKGNGGRDNTKDIQMLTL
jgi:hypothetical protein